MCLEQKTDVAVGVRHSAARRGGGEERSREAAGPKQERIGWKARRNPGDDR